MGVGRAPGQPGAAAGSQELVDGATAESGLSHTAKAPAKSS